ncbi:MAG: hypothetical protein C0518_00985 [Opitutus sp.]|nr:hypothetical protein [Opitutus sp.]
MEPHPAEIREAPILPAWQRACDVLIAGVLALVLLPLFAAVALSILLTMGRPILFRQKRPGLLERPFTMVKFRTMTTAPYSSSDASPDARRITRLGAFLRKTSLDELPELFSVLAGSMSLVGPRPLLLEYLPYYSPTERRRALVRPGLTGLAQTSGRNCLGWDQRLAKDVEFVEQLSPALYWSILLRTPLQVLGGEGVAVDAYSVSLPLHLERQGWRTASK